MRGVRELCGDLGRPVETLALDDRVAGEHLVGFRVRPVGHHRNAVAQLDAPGVHRRGQAAGVDELTGLDQFGVPLGHELVQCRHVRGRPRRLVGGLAGHRVVVPLRAGHHDHVLHGGSSPPAPHPVPRHQRRRSHRRVPDTPPRLTCDRPGRRSTVPTPLVCRATATGVGPAITARSPAGPTRAAGSRAASPHSWTGHAVGRHRPPVAEHVTWPSAAGGDPQRPVASSGPSPPLLRWVVPPSG